MWMSRSCVTTRNSFLMTHRLPSRLTRTCKQSISCTLNLLWHVPMHGPSRKVIEMKHNFPTNRMKSWRSWQESSIKRGGLQEAARQRNLLFVRRWLPGRKSLSLHVCPPLMFLKASQERQAPRISNLLTLHPSLNQSRAEQQTRATPIQRHGTFPWETQKRNVTFGEVSTTWRSKFSPIVSALQFLAQRRRSSTPTSKRCALLLVWSQWIAYLWPNLYYNIELFCRALIVLTWTKHSL